MSFPLNSKTQEGTTHKIIKYKKPSRTKTFGIWTYFQFIYYTY
uniref:Uncharacterized protein n=1 Tax=viral metagenome TaxID=1070528 RepID=A0A6C0LAL2_9ZZZZ